MDTDNTQDGAEPSPASAGSHAAAWAVEHGGDIVYVAIRAHDAQDWAGGGPVDVVPLYREHPRLSAAEREAVERAADWLDRGQETHGYHSAESGDLATLRGLLERLGGEPLFLTESHFGMCSLLLQWPGCWPRGNQVVELMRKTVRVEAWFYALLLFNSAALAVRLVGRVASWFEGERQRSAARDRGLTIPADGIAGPLHRVVLTAKENRMSFSHTNHDAAPTARARTDSATGEPGGGHGSDGTDKPVTRPVLGIGDTFSPIAKRESDRPQPVAWAAECPGPTAEAGPIMLFGYTSQMVNHLALARGEVVHPFPLYRTPPTHATPAGCTSRNGCTLTDTERAAIQRAIDSQQDRAADMHSRSWAAAAIDDDCDTLRKLLGRLAGEPVFLRFPIIPPATG